MIEYLKVKLFSVILYILLQVLNQHALWSIVVQSI